jgi:hypothetical protein
LDVSFDCVVILLEYVRIYKLVFFCGFEVHAELVAKFLLKTLKIVVKQDLLQSPDNPIEFIILLVVSYIR